MANDDAQVLYDMGNLAVGQFTYTQVSSYLRK